MTTMSQSAAAPAPAPTSDAAGRARQALQRMVAALRATTAQALQRRRAAERERAAREACAVEGALVEYAVIEIDGRRFGALYADGRLQCLLGEVHRL